MLKKFLTGLGIVALLVGPTFSQNVTHAEEVSKYSISDEALKERLKNIHNENDKIYQKVLKENTKLKEEKIKSFGSALTYEQEKELKDFEEKYMAKANKAIEKNMIKNGYVKVENPSEDNVVSIAATASNLTVTDNLYYDERYAIYTFIGSWNWTDGTWSQNEDTYDVAAIRSLYKPTAILSSTAYAFDSFGNNRSSYVSKKFENEIGVVYNVQDTYFAPPSAPHTMHTDNGKISMDFRSSGYNKFFLDYEHNYQTYSWNASATISGAWLSESALTVGYTKSNITWQRISGGRVKY